MKNTLVESGEVKDLVALERPTQCPAELMLPVRIFFSDERMRRRCAAVAQIIEQAAMRNIRPGLGDDIDHRAARPPQLCTVRVGGDAELLYHLIAELIRRPIPAGGLAEEAVVVVRAIDQKTGMKSAHAAKSEVAIR